MIHGKLKIADNFITSIRRKHVLNLCLTKTGPFLVPRIEAKYPYSAIRANVHQSEASQRHTRRGNQKGLTEMGSVSDSGDVETIATLAVNSLSSAVKKHIIENHMLPPNQGKSYFLCAEQTVWSLIKEAFNDPDVLIQHRLNNKRYVLKKKFSAPIGIHGKTEGLCSCVAVICDIKEQRIVTAFPTM